MNKSKDLDFEDKSFPLLIHTDSVSHVNDPTTSMQAIHESIEIKYFYEGSSVLLIGNKTVHASRGDVIVINPYEIHSTLDCGTEHLGRYHCIMVGLDFFSGIRAADVNLRHLVFGHNRVFKTKHESDSTLGGIIESIVNAYKANDQYARLSIFGYMATLFSELLRRGLSDESNSTTDDMIRGYSIIEPAVRMIRDRYTENFTVDTLAEACNVSKFHFSRVFKAVMSESPIQYLISYRLAVADNLLSTTDMRIGEVAEVAGFTDVGYFSRMYKRRYGRTPGADKG